MSWRTAAGRAGKRHVKKIEWTETPLSRAPSVATTSRALAMTRLAYRGRRRSTGGLVGVEYKYIDLNRGGLAIPNTWVGGEMDPAVALCLNACVQGTDVSDRDGSKIVLKRIDISGQVYRAAAAAVAAGRAASYITVALVLDTQTNGAQLNAEDVYSTNGVDAYARRVIEYSQRFKVLWKGSFILQDDMSWNDAAATAGVGGVARKFEIHKKMDLPVQYITGAGAGTIADIRDNSLHMIAASTGALDLIEYNSRVRFVG